MKFEYVDRAAEIFKEIGEDNYLSFDKWLDFKLLSKDRIEISFGGCTIFMVSGEMEEKLSRNYCPALKVYDELDEYREDLSFEGHEPKWKFEKIVRGLAEDITNREIRGERT